MGLYNGEGQLLMLLPPYYGAKLCIPGYEAADGNNDLLKLSGWKISWLKIVHLQMEEKAVSGIDMVGCHQGVIQDNYFDRAGVTGIQAKVELNPSGSSNNILKDFRTTGRQPGRQYGTGIFSASAGQSHSGCFRSCRSGRIFSNLFIGSLVAGSLCWKYSCQSHQ